MEFNEAMTWLWLALYGAAMGKTAVSNLQGIWLIIGFGVVVILIYGAKKELELD